MFFFMRRSTTKGYIFKYIYKTLEVYLKDSGNLPASEIGFKNRG